MIIGIGNDIVDIRRIDNLLKKFNDKFKNKIFTAREIEFCEKFCDQNRIISYFAKRFAAKEAFAKACGFGIGEFINFTDLEIVNDKYGKPLIRVLNNKKQIISDQLACKNFVAHLALSDEKCYAMSTVIIEKVK